MNPQNLPTLLIVDDEPLNIKLLARCLRNQYHIKVADNGFKALEIVRNTPTVDLILLDIMMPDMDGFQVCKRLKMDPISERIPVIFITAANDDHSHIEGLELGAVDYIIKPIKPEVVGARVRNQIARKLDDDRIKRYFEEQLANSFYYDTLTELPNKLLLLDRLSQAISASHEQNGIGAVCYIEINEIEKIRREMGLEFANPVIIEVARRICSFQGSDDTVARVGFDEFALVAPGLLKIEYVTKKLARLLESMEEPIVIQERSLKVTMNVGVCTYPLDSSNSKSLLRKAEQAMQLSKLTGKNSFCIHDHQQELNDRLCKNLLAEIESGLANDEFILYYQPKINMFSGTIVGAEALIRWNHPKRGLLQPNEFLSVVENSHMEIPMGDWVIDNALRQLRLWEKQGLVFEISVNISALHLQSESFVRKLKQKLKDYSGLYQDRLQIELLETAAVVDTNSTGEIIRECEKLGISFSLDDFGTGYSSLSYLRELPIKTLKIDQSFVRNMLDDESNLVIVRGIIAIAEALNLQVVAEGVETSDHINALINMNCSIGQGYAIAKPMAATDFIEWAFSSPYVIHRRTKLGAEEAIKELRV